MEKPRPNCPRPGDRCAPCGDWPSGVDWAQGEVVSVQMGAAVVIRTNIASEVRLEARRMTWRETGGEWAVWSPEVDQSVQMIEGHEAACDKKGLRHKALTLGAFVLVERGSKRVGAFVTKFAGQNYICSYGRQHAGLGGVTTCMVGPAMLEWDERCGCWSARYRRGAEPA